MQAVYDLYLINLSQKLRYLVGNVSVYLLAVSLSGISALADAAPRAIKVATASNFLLPLKYLKTEFEQQYPYRLKISAASTTKLYAQILNGAPYDVFLAADTVTTAKLIKKTFAQPESEFLYAQGKLVLWTVKSSYKSREGLKRDFLNADFKRLALPNPKTAPYGRAAMEVLTHFSINVDRSKLILGESVGQAYQFTGSGNVDMGLVAMSQIKSRQIKNHTQYWVLPADAYQPILQYGIMLGKNQQNAAVQEFVRYLKSPDVQLLLRERFGYW